MPRIGYARVSSSDQELEVQLGLSFILSLGPQNLRLLEAGLRRGHVLTLASVGYGRAFLQHRAPPAPRK